MANQPYGNRPQQQRTQQQSRPTQQRSQTAEPRQAGAGDQAPAVVKPSKQKLFDKFANKFGIDPDTLVDTMKATCFKQSGENPRPVTNEQLIMLLIVADQYGLNPFTKEIYAYPDKHGGIVAVVSVDGWIRIINEHPQYNGMEITTAENMVSDDAEVDKKFKHKDCWEWMQVTIYRKDREHQTPVVEYFDEVYRPPLWMRGNGSAGGYYIATPWQTHTKRLMRHKTIIQSGRVTFGFAGIYDEDEAQRILDDERVVSIVPPEDRPATHVAAAKDALRARSAGTAASVSAPATNLKESAKAAKQQAEDLGKAAGKAAPWDEDDEPAKAEPAVQTAWPPVAEKERWISLFRTTTVLKELTMAWAAYVDAADAADLGELDIDIESTYQFRMEQLQQE